MPKITVEFKKQVRELSKNDLEKVILKFAGKDKFLWGYLQVYYLNPQSGAQELFEQTQEGLLNLFEKPFKGKSEAMRRTRSVTACLKYIADFTKIVKQPHLEAELIMQVIDYQFSLPSKLGSYYQTYDNRMARTVKKLIELVRNKVHEDYHLEYADKIDSYISLLRQKIPFNMVVNTLPGQFRD